MKESEIQMYIEQLIKDNLFLDSIQDRDLVDQRYDSFFDEDFVPSFSIDYFSTKKIISSAKTVLDNAYSLEIITTAAQNISLNRQERLFPDLILCNEENGKIIILEIKKSKATARETLTEMLAYEYEIKNLLPFLSNFEVLYCILSTEYSTLLDHSVSSLITWESKQILCLKIEVNNEQKMQMKVYLPSAWTSLGIPYFPYNSFPIFQIILYEKEHNETFYDAESVVLTAANLIAQEGDRSNSNGFVMLWYDSWEGWENVAGSATLHLTVGFINPYVFLPSLESLGMIDTTKNPVSQYFLEKIEELGESHFCIVGYEIIEKSIKFLNKYFNARVEGISCWNDFRIKPNRKNFSIGAVYHRVLPLKVKLWGNLGDFTRELIVHQGMWNYTFSGISNRVISLEDPILNISLIDSLSGINILNNRGITCKVLFELGISLGILASLYETASNIKNNQLKNLPASISWYNLDILPVLLEFKRQYESSKELTVPPPTVSFTTFGTTEKFKEAKQSVELFVNWVLEDFLFEQNVIYSYCFQIGLITYPLHDSYYSFETLPDLTKKYTEEQIYEFSIFLLKNLLHFCLSDYILEGFSKKIINELSESYLELDFDSINDDQDTINLWIKNIPKTKYLDLYDTILVNLIDEITPPCNYNCEITSLEISEYKCIDWIWMKQQILNLYTKGFRYPVLELNSLGEFNIVIINTNDEPDLGVLTKQINFEKQFIFRRSINDIQMYVIQKWEEVGA